MIKMRRLTLFVLMAVMAFHNVSAQTWIDVTNHFIKNPNYDGCDFSYWEGTPLSQYNGFDNAEHYNKSYYTYQSISGLTPGAKYRLSLSAFYRCGSAYNDYRTYSAGDWEQYQYAKLFANTDEDYYETSIALSSSAALQSSLGGDCSVVGNQLYIPNNMAAAHYWFEAGHYLNQVEFTAGAGGVATIGIEKTVNVNEDWTCIDTWRLEMWGQLIDVTGVKMDEEASISIMAGEVRELKAHVLPTDATFQGLVWESTDESVAVVDQQGRVTGITPGKCLIRARAESNTAKFASVTLNVKAGEVTEGSLVINEIQAANVDMFLDPSFNYGSWIELYNTTDQMLALAKLYVSDDPQNLTKHRLPNTIGYVPAKGFKVLWFDHYGIWNLGEHNQIPFKLDYDGGTIIISDGTKIIAQENYPQAISRTSYARTTDCGSVWGVTANPTPEASNAGSKFADAQLAAPVVNKDAQLFTGSLQVRVTIPAGATLRYTTDGSTPTLDNGETSTTGAFTVTETTPYRFRLFKDGMLPSQVVTRTYIYDDKDYSLPIISVNGDYEDLLGGDHGVFIRGTGNGRPGAGQSSACNWNMDWDRPVNFEYIGNEGDGGEYRMLFNQEVDLARCGGWSRAWTPYSFKLKAAKYYYGLNSLNYAFFPEKPFIKNKTLQIRNGGNDTSCRIKDAALQQIVSRSGLYVDGQQWVPVMHFINGEYRGVLNMREPNNKHFAYANYGIDTDEMDQFEISPDSGYVQMEGTKESWDKLYALSQNAADDVVYEEICGMLDIDEYINYMAVQFYLGGSDFPQNNVKGFRYVNDGKFHFVLFDLDAAFSRSGSSFTDFNNSVNRKGDTLHGKYWDGTSIEGKQLSLENEFVLLFKNMVKNAAFRSKFASHFCVIAGSVFEPNRCKAIVNEMATKMEGPMSYRSAYGSGSSPWSTANSIISSLSFSRISTLTSAMASYMGIKATRQEAVISSNVQGAKLNVNDFEIPTGAMNGYLYAPATVQAEPLAGYRFLGWKADGSSSYKTTNLFKSGDTWSYYDGGSLDGKTWKTGTLGTGWKSGETMIGYNSSDNLPTKTEKNLPTYYFRISKTLTSAPTSEFVFNLKYTADDGFIIYVNGNEAARYNMPTGTVTYDTFASTYAHDNPDSGELTLAASLFKKGENIIAVEVHNNNLTSTDIMWDATLDMLEPVSEGGTIVTTEYAYNIPTTGKVNLTAMYEPMSEPELAETGMFPVRINEVSASNSMYVNDYYKKDDWIELYNTTDDPVDVAGMYLSDDVDNPKKYQIEASNSQPTIIEPHGHLVVWASKRAFMGGQLHANFKLSNADEQKVVLTSKDGTWNDILEYCVQNGDETVGRYPDGGNDVFKMTKPTISKTNVLTSYTEYLYTTEYDPTGVKDILANDQSTSVVAVEYFSLNGLAMGKSQSNLEKGVYIVKYTMDDGSVKAKKITIK